MCCRIISLCNKNCESTVTYVFSAIWQRLFAFLPTALTQAKKDVTLASKEVINLKETQKTFAKLAMKIAQAAMIRNANQTTCNIIFQPKVPEGLANYKKVK